MHTTSPTFRAIRADGNTVIATGCLTPAMARQRAMQHLQEELAGTRLGSVSIARNGGSVTWPMARRFFLILPEYGVWIDTSQTRNLPEGIARDEREYPLLFALDNGEQHHGTFDEVDNVFVSATGRRFSPARVSAYLVVPPR